MWSPKSKLKIDTLFLKCDRIHTFFNISPNLNLKQFDYCNLKMNHNSVLY